MSIGAWVPWRLEGFFSQDNKNNNSGGYGPVCQVR